MLPQLGNYVIEPPGLFRGRGAHPRMGCLKQRVMPEDITLNIAAGEWCASCAVHVGARMRVGGALPLAVVCVAPAAP